MRIRATALAAIGVAAVLVGGCQRNQTEEPSVQTQTPEARSTRSDSELETAVRGRLFTVDAVRGSRIDVSVDDGVATLDGTVSSNEAKQEAVNETRAVDGIARVDDQLQVAAATTGTGTSPTPGPNAPAATVGQTNAGEPTVTTRILSQYFAAESVKPWNIDVSSTSDGVVTLDGEVGTAEARQDAERIARNTAGVTSVENHLRVRDEDTGSPAATTGSGIATTQQPDAWVTTKIQAKYFIDDDVKGRDIDVDTQNGVVTLRGVVSSAAERRQAIALARNTDGVTEVKDQLTLQEESGRDTSEPLGTQAERAGSRIEDGWITTKLQAKYFIDDEVKGRDINVNTQNGVVTLQGTVDSAAEKTTAEQIARDTDGVTRVVNQLRVAPAAATQ